MFTQHKNILFSDTTWNVSWPQTMIVRHRQVQPSGGYSITNAITASSATMNVNHPGFYNVCRARGSLMYPLERPSNGFLWHLIRWREPGKSKQHHKLEENIAWRHEIPQKWCQSPTEFPRIGYVSDATILKNKQNNNTYNFEFRLQICKQFGKTWDYDTTNARPLNGFCE